MIRLLNIKATERPGPRSASGSASRALIIAVVFPLPALASMKAEPEPVLSHSQSWATLASDSVGALRFSTAAP